MAFDVRLTIDDIFHVACDLKDEARSVYLDEACAGNGDLRREVEDLIRHHETSATFLERPALHDAAIRLARNATTADEDPGKTPDSPDSPDSPDDAGWMIGQYRITGQLGRGGMGVVYLADDTLLDRQVAIKVLQKSQVQNEDRVARFAREARMMEELKQLKHPNIAEIYEETTHNDSPCIVLEYVPGETLADRLERGPIPANEALRLAKQIAEALISAHRQHIVHRDLKPANIRITPDGTIKVLDFGLAKRFYPEPGSEEISEFQTHSLSLTESGMIIGTPAYMSPEQWNGSETDQRTDLWAFGCVLYEMLTGRAPFARRTRAETMKAILESSPDWQSLPQDTPIVIQDLLRKCLIRDSALRLKHTAEAGLAIDEALGEGRFAPGLLLKSWIWKIDRKVITAASAIAIVAGSIGIWNYPPARNFLSRRQTISIEISARDDLTAILQKKFKGSNPEVLRAVMNSGTDLSGRDVLVDEDARALRQNQDYKKGIDEIIDVLKKKIAAEGATAQIQAILAQAYLFRYYLIEDERDKSEAVKLAGEARKLAPESLEVMIALGEVFNAIGWQRDAIQTLTAADSKYPGNPDVLIGLARAYDIGGDDDVAAEKSYQAAIDARFKQDGHYFWSDYNELGAFYFSRGKYEMAVWNWSKVIELEKLNPTGYSNLGQALMAEGCLQPAVDALTSSIRVRGTPEAYINLGAALIYAGRYIAAINVMEDVTKRRAVEDQNQMELWGNLGDAYRLGGRSDDAATAYDNALRLAQNHLLQHPGDSDVISQKAEYVAKLNALGRQNNGGENPILIIDELLKKQGDCLSCLVSGAVVFQIAGNRNKALEYAGQAVDGGYSIPLLLNNPDLAGLRDQKEFRQLAARYRAKC
jgi:serine/threonine protein kinase/tetratricopeptide (TPR) repeat protein